MRHLNGESTSKKELAEAVRQQVKLPEQFDLPIALDFITGAEFGSKGVRIFDNGIDLGLIEERENEMFGLTPHGKRMVEEHGKEFDRWKRTDYAKVLKEWLKE